MSQSLKVICDTVVSRGELLGRGASPSAITRAAVAGSLVAIGRGLFATGPSPDVLAVAQRYGALSHTTAASLLGLDLVVDPGVHVTTAHRRRSPPPEVVVHRGSLGPEDSMTTGGLRLTTPLRTAVDCARQLPQPDAVVLLDSVLRTAGVPETSLRDAFADLTGPGSARARRALALCDGRSESALETLARLLFQAHGLTPELQVDIYDAGHFVGRVDMLFRAEGLVVELDGFQHHADRRAFRRDRLRHNALMCAGFRVVRFTWEDVVGRPDYVLAAVRQLLTAGR
jgi:hypothetical protein